VLVEFAPRIEKHQWNSTTNFGYLNPFFNWNASGKRETSGIFFCATQKCPDKTYQVSKSRHTFPQLSV
jgi:hypothetical protein